MKKLKLPSIYDILLALIGVSMCGIGAGFVNCAVLGMDSIGIFYDGIRSIIGLTSDGLGIASFIVNGILIVFLFIVSRKNVSFGTIIYTVAYGSFISVGNFLYGLFVSSGTLTSRIIFCVIGYVILYLGISLYVAIDIGVDAFTGVVLFLADLTHFQLRYVKIVFDIILIIIGALLGGTLGAATFVTMVLAGPFIQFFSKRFQSIYFRLKIKSYKKSETDVSNKEKDV